MNPTYAVYTHIDRPPEDVFNAVVDHNTFQKVMFQSASADLVQGTDVTWDNGEWSVQVHVDLVVPNERIEVTFRPADFAIPLLRAGDKRDYDAKLVFLFEPADMGGTLVTICEYGWGTDKRSVLQSYGHCSGWQDMLMCLKGLLMFGVELKSPHDAKPNYKALWLEG